MEKEHAQPRHLRPKHIPLSLALKRPMTVLATLPQIRRALPYTTLRYAALMQMYDCVAAVERAGVPGSIVETGCGRGGCSAFMAASAESLGADRQVWMFDSFQGLSDPAEQDWKGNMKDPERVKKGYLSVSRDAAEEAVRAMGLNHPERVHVVEGWFNESLPPVIDKLGDIAVLRLDADLYEPTKYVLEQLYDRVSPGGYVVFDDYKNWIGCRRAVHEFFCEHDVHPYFQSHHYGGKPYFQKPQE